MKINPRVVVMREAVTKIVPMLSERKVRVTQRGTRAYVEYDERTGTPKCVNVPYIPDDATDELLDAIQGFIDHEVGHCLFTDVEVLREARKLGVAGMHNLVEDPFVEKRMAHRFTGSAHNLASTGKFFLREFIDKAIEQNPENAAASLIVPLVRAWAGQTVFQEYMKDHWHRPEVKQLVADLGPDMPALIERCGSSKDCLNVAIEMKKRLKNAESERAEKSEKNSEGEGNSDAEGSDEDSELSKNLGEKESKAKRTSSENIPASEDDESVDDADSNSSNADWDDSSDDLSENREEDSPKGSKSEGVSSAGDEAPSDESDKSGDDTRMENEGDSSEDSDEVAPSGTAESEELGDTKPRPFDPEAGKGETGDPKAKPPEEGSWVDRETKEFAPSAEEVAKARDELEEEVKLHVDKMLGELPDFDEALGDLLSNASEVAARASSYVVYTRDEDRIEPLKFPEGSHPAESDIKMMHEAVDHMLHPLMKDIERAMAARSAVVWTGGHRSGRLHAASLVRAKVGNRDDAFRRKQENHSKDVAVSVVVDCSGSMMGPKIKLACYSAFALTSVLDRLGIPCEVIGFTTAYHSMEVTNALVKEAGETDIRYSRTQPLLLPILKEWGERVSPLVKRRFAETATNNAVPCDQNVDGESIQIAAFRLQQRRERRKVMIVFSDGQPMAYGDVADLATHLKHVAEQIQKSGIDIVGMGIMSDAVTEYYKKAIVMHSLSEFPSEVMRQLKQILIQ